MFLIYAGTSFDIKHNKDVTFIGYKIKNIMNNRGIEIIRYFMDNQQKDVFYKEIEFKLDLLSDRWEKRVFQLSKEEFEKEFKRVPEKQKINY